MNLIVIFEKENFKFNRDYIKKQLIILQAGKIMINFIVYH